MLPGTLQLTECLQSCKQNDSCQSVNFETGLCVLLIHSAREKPEALTSSQFPVFTIYAQKMCLSGESISKATFFMCDSNSVFDPEINEYISIISHLNHDIHIRHQRHDDKAKDNTFKIVFFSKPTKTNLYNLYHFKTYDYQKSKK